MDNGRLAVSDLRNFVSPDGRDARPPLTKRLFVYDVWHFGEIAAVVFL